jgi:hypothetical protein
MKKRSLFRSSVQKEFEGERLALRDYLHADPLLQQWSLQGWVNGWAKSWVKGWVKPAPAHSGHGA